MAFDVMQAFKERNEEAPKRSFFGQAGFTATRTYQEAYAKAIEPYTTRDGQKASVDIMRPGYQEAVDKARKETVPPWLNGFSVQDRCWTFDAATRENMDREKHPSMRVFHDQVESFRLNGDSGRYVRLLHDHELSGYLMEVEPVGDVHRFLDLEAPDGTSRMLQLPHGSYIVDSSYGPSPMVDDAILMAKTNYRSYDDIPTYTPPECQAEVERMLSEAKGPRKENAAQETLGDCVDRLVASGQPYAEMRGADGKAFVAAETKDPVSVSFNGKAAHADGGWWLAKGESAGSGMMARTMQDMSRDGSGMSVEAYHLPGVKTMFLNMKAGQGLAVPGGLEGATCHRDVSVPVGVLFNENSTVGEVVPLMDMDVTFKSPLKGGGFAKGWSEVEAGENFAAGMDALSAEPLPQFRDEMMRKFGKDVQPDGRTLEDALQQDARRQHTAPGAGAPRVTGSYDRMMEQYVAGSGGTDRGDAAPPSPSVGG